MRRMIDTYNAERERYARACAGKAKDGRPAVETVIDTDPRRIS